MSGLRPDAKFLELGGGGPGPVAVGGGIGGAGMKDLSDANRGLAEGEWVALEFAAGHRPLLSDAWAGDLVLEAELPVLASPTWSNDGAEGNQAVAAMRCSA